jgi:hypothetical protein
VSLATGAEPKAASRASDKRRAIVDALATVPGITPYALTPDQATAGAAWPNWTGNTYDGRLSETAVRTYEVLVTLPASYLSVTVDQGDSFVDLVADALMRIGVLTFAEPVLIPFQDKQTMPGLRLRVTLR